MPGMNVKLVAIRCVFNRIKNMISRLTIDRLSESKLMIACMRSDDSKPCTFKPLKNNMIKSKGFNVRKEIEKHSMSREVQPKGLYLRHSPMHWNYQERTSPKIGNEIW